MGNKKIHFRVTDSKVKPRKGDKFPLVILAKDGWNDFGFTTLFHSHLWLSTSEHVEIGPVKILTRNLLARGRQPFIRDKFNRMSPHACSLGQSLSYYRALYSLKNETLVASYLLAMRDCTWRPEYLEKYKESEAYRNSLIRQSEAEKVLREGKSIAMTGRSRRRSIAFSFLPPQLDGKVGDRVPFRFSQQSRLPSRMTLLVGRNGTGKTRLLSQIAQAMSGGIVGSDLFFHPSRPLVSSVLAVSYSVFDRFEIPKGNTFQNYYYLGIRNEDGKLRDPTEPNELFTKSLSVVFEKNREGYLNRLYYHFTGSESQEHVSVDEWIEKAGSFSAGQRICFDMVVNLLAQLEKESLVLLDEPETHLHPGLLSTLCALLNELLEEFNAYAIVATHSSVLIRQVPKVHINWLVRSGEHISVLSPPFETFGASLEEIDQELFGLSEPERDYRSILKTMVDLYGIDVVRKEIFVDGLGVLAESYLSSIARHEEESGS